MAIKTNSSKVPTYSDFNQCVYYPGFSNFGWETLYTKYKYNVLRILNVHKTTSRLFVLIKLDLFRNDLNYVVSELTNHRLNQSAEAIQLTVNLKDILPDADPVYLDIVGEIYAFNHDNLFDLIGKVITKKQTYPKLKEYNEDVKNLNTINSLTVSFEAKEFLRICPNPVDYFENKKLNSFTLHYHESISYLSERFCYLPLQRIRFMLDTHKYNLTKTVEALTSNPDKNVLRTKRKTFSRQVNYKLSENIEFLKEIAFLNHKDELLNYIKTEKQNYQTKVNEAKRTGQLCACECCYNDELLNSEVYTCPVGHNFCSPCIKKGIEVAVGASKIELKCFANCNEEFNLIMIKDIVDEKLYEHIMRLKQAQELKEANIKDLETCAFCDYSVILSPEIKIINCLNPECKKITCRECREESHFPYRCDQIEKAPEVKIRTMIENKMTEVLIRKCYYCNRTFVKEDGCNKIVCTCGKQMCYICRKPIIDSNYSHFYHNKVMEDRCPLYTDEDIVHSIAVEAAAKLILNELKEKQPELLRNINIDKILPPLNSKHVNKEQKLSPIDVNSIVALVIGQNVEDVNNLKDLRLVGPQPKKSRH